MNTPGTARDRILMGPGPSNPYPSAVAALTRPMVGHMDPSFLATLDETNDLLRQAFGTTNRLTFPISGTGSAGMEAAFSNVIQPGDVAVIGVNGVFGERMCETAERLGAEIVRVEARWGTPIDPEALLNAHNNPKVIALVHAETSTGVRNDPGPLGQYKGNALLILDCVTSLGGINVELDTWKVDIAFSGTQKCLGVPPGLAPFSVSNAALQRINKHPTTWYLDLNMIAQYVVSDQGRAYHHTAPISMIHGLHAGLEELMSEGLNESFARHKSVGKKLRDGLRELGLKPFVSDEDCLPQLTTVWVPESRLPKGLSESDLRRILLDEYQIEIGAGLQEYAGRIWRIGLMGNTARHRNVTLLLGALRELLA